MAHHYLFKFWNKISWLLRNLMEKYKSYVPIVGMEWTTSPNFNLYKMVVFPAASNPTIKIRISFLPMNCLKIECMIPISKVESFKKLKLSNVISISISLEFKKIKIYFFQLYLLSSFHFLASRAPSKILFCLPMLLINSWTWSTLFRVFLVHTSSWSFICKLTKPKFVVRKCHAV